ncbi:MAG TPA: CRISPR-associated endonuclease Cas1, partial [Chitinophagales bacterium]|nr:CRISPR-associated endonuclease Cas1 [Chitinophagales bacterium]
LLQPLLFITDIFAQNEIFHKNQQCNIIYESLSSKFAIDAAAILRKRKREYELKEFENHEIIITGFGKSIGMAKNHCTVKQDGKLIQKVPLLNVEHISIQTDACSISAALINYCAEKNIPIDFTDFSGEPTARLFSAMNDTYQLWHLQFLHLFNTEAQQVACALIIAKINNQKKLIRYFSKYGKKHILELAPALQQSLECLDQCIEKIKNRNIHQLDELRQKLINIEAQASLAYWEIVRIFLDEETNFDNRIRKGATDLVNSLINYGYSILYRHVWTSILRQGLHPSFSYIHQAKKFEGTLVFDFIEPFRQPIVDRAVISLINRKTTLEVKNGKLTDDTKKKLIIAVNDRLRRYDTYLGERKTMFNIINKQAQHYVQYLHDDCKKFKPYQMSKW